MSPMSAMANNGLCLVPELFAVGRKLLTLSKADSNRSFRKFRRALCLRIG